MHSCYQAKMAAERWQALFSAKVDEGLNMTPYVKEATQECGEACCASIRKRGKTKQQRRQERNFIGMFAAGYQRAADSQNHREQAQQAEDASYHQPNVAIPNPIPKDTKFIDRLGGDAGGYSPFLGMMEAPSEARVAPSEHQCVLVPPRSEEGGAGQGAHQQASPEQRKEASSSEASRCFSSAWSKARSSGKGIVCTTHRKCQSSCRGGPRPQRPLQARANGTFAGHAEAGGKVRDT